MRFSGETESNRLAGKCVENTVEIAVMINGKVRAKLQVAADLSEQDAIAAARANGRVQEFLADMKIVKEIYVKGKLVNIVAKP